MNILVYFQISSDYDKVLDKEWEEGMALDLSFTQKMYGCFDEGALETALCLKEAYEKKGVFVYLKAVTTGLKSPMLMSALYGAGFDEVLYMDLGKEITSLEKEIIPFSTMAKVFHQEKPSGSSPCEDGRMHGQEIGNLDADIILTGRMSGGLGDRMAAPSIAAQRKIPWLMDGVDLYPGDRDGEVYVLCEQENAYILRRQKTPFVCSMGNAVHGVLRMFSLKARIAAKKKKITSLDISACPLVFSEFKMKKKEKKGQCQWLTGDTGEIASSLVQMVREGEVAGR